MLTATEFNLPDTISTYNVVLFVHVVSAIIAFGAMFSYPVVYAVLRQPVNRRMLGAWHRGQARVLRMVVTPAATLLLLSGIYMVSKGVFTFSSKFVGIGIAVVVIVLGLTGAMLTPSERKAAELADRDVQAAKFEAIDLSPEYLAVAKRLQLFGGLSGLLVLVAVFVMVTKIGAST